MTEQSVLRCRRFHDLGKPFTLSINIAPETLAHPAFIERIRAGLERHQVRPDYLTCDLPGSSVLTRDPAFLEQRSTTN